MNLTFTDRVALVTGAGRGIGKAIAEDLAREGVKVICLSKSESSCGKAAEEIRAQGGNAVALAVDVSDGAAVAQAAEALLKEHGKIDILVNNAGIINRKTIADMSVAEWRKVMDVNATGAFAGLKAALPLMAETGGGSVINISSNSGFSGHYDPAYTASKWALRGLTRTAAMEYAEKGVRVNAICPGLIVTDLNRNSPHLKPMIEMTPMGRSGEAEEVAQLVLFLASDASAFITGEDFVIDGGFTGGAAYRRVARETGIY
ncbi:MAG: SDR family NAD(P)-dependent oxidoreductase [Verrucomicrobiota bacterium JB022]|nr:SDR family NAD(P)-dependent oxidoreductase [Verrucomicrobiota bacterium JB022]